MLTVGAGLAVLVGETLGETDVEGVGETSGEIAGVAWKVSCDEVFISVVGAVFFIGATEGDTEGEGEADIGFTLNVLVVEALSPASITKLCGL